MSTRNRDRVYESEQYTLAKQAENDHRWNDAVNIWQSLYEYSGWDGYFAEANVCRRLAEAVSKGDDFRKNIQEELEKFHGLSESMQNMILIDVWQLHLNIIHSDIKRRIVWFLESNYPHVPIQEFVVMAKKKYGDADNISLNESPFL